jgi:hypothetical protein
MTSTAEALTSPRQATRLHGAGLSPAAAIGCDRAAASARAGVAIDLVAQRGSSHDRNESFGTPRMGSHSVTFEPAGADIRHTMNPVVLRGLVDQAYYARGTDKYRAECEELLCAWHAWPLVVALPAIRNAERLLAERGARIDSALQALRDSYPAEAACAG